MKCPVIEVTPPPPVTCINCTDPRPFPQPYETISLTNWIELIKVDDLYNPVKNKFEIIRQTSPLMDLKPIAAGLGVVPSKYDIYQATKILQGFDTIGFRILPIPFHTYLQIYTTYFFVNKKFSNKSREQLRQQLWEIYRTRAGTRPQSSVYFPHNPIRFPYVMPSRGVVMRD